MYKFDPSGEPLAETFRAIALSQLDEVVAVLSRTDTDRQEMVHEGRRRCKKLRGLLRLVRPAFPDFARENRTLRDAAALLSHLRDADVLRHTLRELAEHSGGDADRLRAIADRLEREDSQSDARLAEFAAAIQTIRERAGSWTLAKHDGSALVAGLRDTYRQARRRMHKSAETRLPADLHEWRKAAKNHGFHVDLLKRIAPDLLEDDLNAVETLATCLGLHHDLAVLRDAVANDAARFGDANDVSVVHTAIARRLLEIEARAFDLGRQVFAERPNALRRRFAAYWESTA